MRRPAIVWRLIDRIERHLPSVPSATELATARRSDADRRSRRWTGLAVFVPSFVLMIVQVLSHRSDWAVVWPMWRPMILQLVLVVAGGVLVAAVAAGVIAWRREGRRHA